MKSLITFINILRVIGYAELIISIVMMFQQIEKQSAKAIVPGVVAIIVTLVLLELNTWIINIKNDNNNKN